MATTVTVVGVNVAGNMRYIWGTFTTATGDTTITIATGLSALYGYQVTLDAGAIGTEVPKVSTSGGTITGLVTDTLGYSGRFYGFGM